MSDGLPYADIVILALIAGFILLRLRNVLGQKIEHDAPTFDFQKRLPEAETPVVMVPDRTSKAGQKEEEDKAMDGIAEEPLRSELKAIRAADTQFNLTHFLTGARGAFEMVFDAFAKGEKKPLEMLLSPAMYKEFSAAIDSSATQENKPESTLVAVTSQEVVSASLVKNTARIGVKFVSEQVSVVRDAKGAIIEGDPTQTEKVEDEWVFERDVNSRSPNWTVVDT